MQWAGEGLDMVRCMLAISLEQIHSLIIFISMYQTEYIFSFYYMLYDKKDEDILWYEIALLIFI